MRDKSKLNATLLPHQQEGVDWIVRTPKGVLADDVGLGKTVQALAAIGRLLDSAELPHSTTARRLCRVLWVTDASLLDQTKAEAERFVPGLSVLSGLDRELGTGARAQRLMKENYPHGVDLLILSYETVQRRKEWLSHFSPAKLVLDEASNIKGGSKLFEAVRDIAARTPRVLSMTATPLENDPTELWRVLCATDTPGLWPASEFDSRFVSWRTGWVDQWGNAHRVPDGWLEYNLGPVREHLSRYLLRRTPEDAGLGANMPVRVPPFVLSVPLTPEQERAYAEAQKLTRRDAVQRMEVASLFGGPRPPMVVALLRELARHPDESAIVYCGALEMLDILEAHLMREGITSCRIEGKVSDADRRIAIERHKSGEARVLIASRVLEYGLNLQHCRLLYSLDTSWNPARENQREGRLRRLGSPHATYQHLVIRPETPLARAKAAKLDRKLRSAELVGLAPASRPLTMTSERSS